VNKTDLRSKHKMNEGAIWSIYGRYPVIVVMPVLIVVINEAFVDMRVFKSITCAK